MPYFNYNGKNVYYLETGQGKPLLLLHGNTASSKMFNDVIKLYTNHFRIITIDFLGHGKSDRLEHFPTDLWYDEARQVIEFIQQSSYEKVDIIGTSGGAIVAINVALEGPDLVGKIIADSFEGERPLSDFMETIREEREHSKKENAGRPFYEFNHGADWESVVDNDTEALYNHYQIIGRFYHKSLNKLKIPVLLTGSKKDEFIPPGFFQEVYGDMLNKIPYAQMYLFEEGGHPAMLSNSEEFARLTYEFLK
ncbi:MAG: alpha/beta hydrolase [Bacteroides sp.]|nr:alpha/beta hydrolase [Bacteroides sp.]